MHNDIKDIEVIERAMKRLDELQHQHEPIRMPLWTAWIIPAMLAVWLVVMIAKTGGVL